MRYLIVGVSCLCLMGCEANGDGDASGVAGVAISSAAGGSVAGVHSETSRPSAGGIIEGAGIEGGESQGQDSEAIAAGALGAGAVTGGQLEIDMPGAGACFCVRSATG